MQKILHYSVKLVVVLLAMILTTQLQAATRTASISGNWSSTATWGGNPVPTASDDVIIYNTSAAITVTVDIAAVCQSLTFKSSIKASTLSISGTNSLQVTNAVIINAGTLTNAHKIINVGSGSLSCASVTMGLTVSTRTCQIEIGTGTVTIAGNLTMNGNATANMIKFTAAGTMNIGGNIGGSLKGDIIPSTGTVNYNGNALQMVAMNNNYEYYNLNFNNPTEARLESYVNNTRVLGNITVESGIFSNGGFGMVGNSGKTFAVADGATFLLGGTSTFPTVFNVNLAAGSFVEYNGTNQAVADIASPGYGFLTLSNTGTKTAGGGLDIRGDLFIYSETATPVTFAADAYTHNVAGNWLNVESVVTGNSTVNFNGSTEQFIDGSLLIQTFHNISIASGSSVITYAPLLEINNNLTINSTGQLTIPPTIGVTCTGTINNAAGVTGLVVQSDETGTGSLINSNAGVPATVQRYIAAANWTTWYSGWHFLSSPVAAQAISGNWTPSGANGDYDFYAWDEPSNNWINFKNTTTPPTFITVNPGTNFVVGRGYEVAYEQSASHEFSGLLNVANVNKTLTVTSPNVNYSWNLLGNPYPCSLTWHTGWTLNNVGAISQVWSDAILDYVPLIAGEGIPAMNGFMVEALTNGASLTIPASARTQDPYTPWYKSGQTSNRIKLTARSADKVTGKESILLLNPNSTVDFDAQFDGHYLAGQGPKFYSLAGDDQLTVNSLPELGNDVQIPFVFAKNNSGNFTIELDTENLIPDLDIYLTDKKTGHEANLTENPVYAFSSDEGDDINRFTVHFLTTTGVAPVKENNSMHVYASGNTLYINQSDLQTGKVYLYSLTGQMMSTSLLEASPSQSISLPQLAPGMYLVNIRTGLGSYTQKIILK